MAKNVTEKVIRLIALDNQLISVVEDQGFLHHLEFLNPWYALPSLHYITLTPLSSYNVPVCTLVLWVSYSRTCKTGNRGDVEHMSNRQATRPCNFTHTLKLAVHEGLLSQCSATDSPANTRKVVGHCCNSICRIRKRHMKVYTLFQQKKTIKEQLGCRSSFLNAAVLSRKILVKVSEYRIETWYRYLLNIKGRGSG